jgi:hypothetical protein
VLSSVTKALDFEKGIAVLDVGCGSGVWVMVRGSLNYANYCIQLALLTDDFLNRIWCKTIPTAPIMDVTLSTQYTRT